MNSFKASKFRVFVEKKIKNLFMIICLNNNMKDVCNMHVKRVQQMRLTVTLQEKKTMARFYTILYHILTGCCI